jgi:hypothetical protein
MHYKDFPTKINTVRVRTSGMQAIPRGQRYIYPRMVIRLEDHERVVALRNSHVYRFLNPHFYEGLTNYREAGLDYGQSETIGFLRGGTFIATRWL